MTILAWVIIVLAILGALAAAVATVVSALDGDEEAVLFLTVVAIIAALFALAWAIIRTGVLA